jgi:hypothetical protein
MPRKYSKQIVTVDLNGPQGQLNYLRAIHSAMSKHTGHDRQAVWDELHANPDDSTHHHNVMKNHYSDWINFIDLEPDSNVESESV